MKVQVYKYIGEDGAGLVFRPVEGAPSYPLSDIEPQLSLLGEWDLPEDLLKAVGKDDLHPDCYGSVYVEE